MEVERGRSIEERRNANLTNRPIIAICPRAYGDTGFFVWSSFYFGRLCAARAASL